jgi:hypothetical protein
MWSEKLEIKFVRSRQPGISIMFSLVTLVDINQKTHVVYSIPCGDCEKEYLGQSKRQYGTRLKEHRSKGCFNFNQGGNLL